MTRLHAVFAIACIGAATAIATPAEASISRDLSRSAFSIKATTDAGPFASAPRLVQPSLTQELKAIEQRQVAAAECVALCDLSASVEAHPFGVASAEPPNRSEDAWGNYRPRNPASRQVGAGDLLRVTRGGALRCMLSATK